MLTRHDEKDTKSDENDNENDAFVQDRNKKAKNNDKGQYNKINNNKEPKDVITIKQLNANNNKVADYNYDLSSNNVNNNNKNKDKLQQHNAQT